MELSSAKAVLLSFVQPLLLQMKSKARSVARESIQGGAEVPTQGGIGGSQTGRQGAYAAADKSETGKSNDLCSSWFASLKS